jgi:hypothetical protein
MQTQLTQFGRFANVRTHHLKVNRRGQVIRDEANDLLLPEAEVYRRIRDAAEREGVTPITYDGIKGRHGDTALPPGQYGVYSRDERDVRDGLRPGLYADIRAGEEPIVVVGGGRHLQDMKDQVDDMRDRGEDKPPERDNPWPKSPTEMFWELREIGLRLRSGKRTYGYGTYGPRRGRPARPGSVPGSAIRREQGTFRATESGLLIVKR